MPISMPLSVGDQSVPGTAHTGSGRFASRMHLNSTTASIGLKKCLGLLTITMRGEERRGIGGRKGKAVGVCVEEGRKGIGWEGEKGRECRVGSKEREGKAKEGTVKGWGYSPQVLIRLLPC